MKWPLCGLASYIESGIEAEIPIAVIICLNVSIKIFADITARPALVISRPHQSPSL
jgi:hypothetical protein